MILLWHRWFLTELKKTFEFLSPKFNHWTEISTLRKLFLVWANLTYSLTYIDSSLWKSKSKGISYIKHWTYSMTFLAIKTLSNLRKELIKVSQNTLNTLQLFTQDKHRCTSYFLLPSLANSLLKLRIVSPKIKILERNFPFRHVLKHNKHQRMIQDTKRKKISFKTRELTLPLHINKPSIQFLQNRIITLWLVQVNIKLVNLISFKHDWVRQLLRLFYHDDHNIVPSLFSSI
jgi:hypothetical protein